LYDLKRLDKNRQLMAKQSTPVSGEVQDLFF